MTSFKYFDLCPKLHTLHKYDSLSLRIRVSTREKGRDKTETRQESTLGNVAEGNAVSQKMGKNSERVLLEQKVVNGIKQ